ncbi:hypothetical protein AYY26_20915 [Photobacterium phosphoreum]|uniref:hypothetical protein n=1 Tax=Photobacterium phosphoreum TaxID=659 RepID=UPI0007F9543B|nr:hypothetical protein [Photobacterium phosphoreum]OBU41470.1 hypothetical protein AYY26_20915 [Photobacterium phosphoreum]
MFTDDACIDGSCDVRADETNALGGSGTGLASSQTGAEALNTIGSNIMDAVSFIGWACAMKSFPLIIFDEPKSVQIRFFSGSLLFYMN